MARLDGCLLREWSGLSTLPGPGPRSHAWSVKVTEIMSRSVIAVTPATPIKEAARLLVEHGVSALPVLDARGELVGIVSEADLIKVEARPDPRSQATPVAPSAGTAPRMVSDVMTTEVISVKAATEVSQAVRTMLDAGIKRVPVLDGRRVIGVVSRRDLMRVIARSDQSVSHDVEEKNMALDAAGAWKTYTAMTPAESAAGFDFLTPLAGRPVTQADVEPVTWAIIQRGRAQTAVEHVNLMNALRGLSRDIAADLMPYDV